MNDDRLLTVAKLREFFERLGASARSSGACFITGGGSAILFGWRDTTVDVNLKFEPEPAGVFDAIPTLKRELGINVELACPSDFIPPLPGWRDRCRHIGSFGKLEVFHYDFASQALAKLSRGHGKDLSDVNAMLRAGLVTNEQLLAEAEVIRPQLKRYPALDEASFLRRVKLFVQGAGHV